MLIKLQTSDDFLKVIMRCYVVSCVTCTSNKVECFEKEFYHGGCIIILSDLCNAFNRISCYSMFDNDLEVFDNDTE